MYNKRYEFTIMEAYGDECFCGIIYAPTKDHAYGRALKEANAKGFDFPVITINEI